jgi:hypothetical protein
MATPPPAKPIVEKAIELKDLKANAEGVVSIGKEVLPTQQCTVVNSREFLGYGGPIAIEDIESRGLFKALGGDGIYELSDGGKYVLPSNLAEALGIVIPPPETAELLLITGAVDPGDERLTGEALDNAILAKAANEGRDKPTTLSFRDKVFYTIGQKSAEERKVATQHAPAPPAPPKKLE